MVGNGTEARVDDEILDIEVRDEAEKRPEYEVRVDDKEAGAL